MTTPPNSPDPAVVRAKELLREQLSQHADPGVRVLNEMAELADDHPAVVRIADHLRAAQKGEG